ncbi:MAG: hypothetical protein QW727_00030 [Candidatus Pacearchaeota archaeon]
MVVENILMSYFAVRVIYPFLLVFTLIFAILQKSKILGEQKSQVDALVALSIALIVVGFSWSTDIIVGLMPFLAVSVVILLVFMILFGFVASDFENGLKLNKGIKAGIGILIVLALVITILIITGQWDRVYYALFVDYSNNNLLSNIILLIVVVGAIAVVLVPGSRGKKND